MITEFKTVKEEFGFKDWLGVSYCDTDKKILKKLMNEFKFNESKNGELLVASDDIFLSENKNLIDCLLGHSMLSLGVEKDPEQSIFSVAKKLDKSESYEKQIDKISKNKKLNYLIWLPKKVNGLYLGEVIDENNKQKACGLDLLNLENIPPELLVGAYYKDEDTNKTIFLLNKYFYKFKDAIYPVGAKGMTPCNTLKLTIGKSCDAQGLKKNIFKMFFGFNEYVSDYYNYGLLFSKLLSEDEKAILSTKPEFVEESQKF